jgi:hypothetical protein
MPLDFQFDCPLALFEKGDAPIGKQRRIAGIISTETRDRQGEVLLQNGLNFDSFLKNGWYNDNHTKDTTGILGYPESVRRFGRGEILPDGNVADTNCTWAEGYLLPTKKADEIWELGQALSQTGRRLGYSVEGKIQKRIGPNKKTVAQALVRNVAITNCFPAYVRVTGTAEGISRRQYAGPMVEIELATGEKLTGTPNHPIFTQRGWVPLGELNEAHDRVGRLRRDASFGLSAAIAHDVYDVPPRLEQVFNLSLLAQAPRRVCAGEKSQFHGDGSNRNVHIVGVDGLLKRRLQATFFQKFSQLALPATDKAQRSLARFGLFAQLLQGSRAAAACFIRSQSALALLLAREQLATPQLLGATGTGDAMAFGDVEDARTSDSILGGDCGRTLSPAIGFSNLKSKRVFYFCGHVFNLETQHGWYNANGVVVHNCPVNDNTRLEVLAKSLQSVEDEEDEKIKTQKALMAGPATGPSAPVGPQTGVGAGRVIMGQSLEHAEKYLTKSEAIAWLVTRQPSLTGVQAERIWNLTRRRIASGQR